MNKDKMKFKKNVKKPYNMYVLFNKRVTEFIGSKIKLKFKKKLILTLILNLEFNLI